MEKQIKILGFNITSINVERNPNFDGKIDVQTNVNINSLDRQKLELIKDDALKVEFIFSVSYKELGSLKIKGNLLLLIDSKLLKQALSDWEDKKVPAELNTAILNLLIQKCSLKALQLEQELGLPLHIPMPQVKVKED